MDSDKYGSVYRALVRVRHLFDEALDPHSSLIAIDLLLATASRPGAGRSTGLLTVKQLFAQLQHSDRAVRIHFNRLVSEGLLSTEPGADDRRTKLVRLTPRGEHLLRKVASTLIQTLQRDARRATGPAGARRSNHSKADGARRPA